MGVAEKEQQQNCHTNCVFCVQFIDVEEMPPPPLQGFVFGVCNNYRITYSMSRSVDWWAGFVVHNDIGAQI